MNKVTISTIVASVIAGTALFGFTSISIDNFSVAHAKEIMKQENHHQVKPPVTKQPEAEKAVNDSFRNIKAEKTSLLFEIKGEASVFEGTYNYSVKQGKKEIASGFGTASMGGPEWGKVKQMIAIPVNKLSAYAPLTIELYEIDQESGKQVRTVKMPLSLNKTGKSKGNEVFRKMTVAPVAVEYTVKGEARLHEGTYNYTVKQGKKEIASGFGTASIGAPEWGQVKQTIMVPTNKLSVNQPQPLTLDLFSIDMESGEAVDKWTIKLS
ncbi:Gmad2 immunoglobulin-like domain-containing protein [Paenibacillus spongiae]|uniref:Gmad2 immunoglobulin-like domain-containing protein n=1 Tax=Paenibacillus spongiae TaxID=2909671 RepID=A0ABY5S3Y9_9BACL|nr:Gmad2 immunoglobulin-like domain-containing protein [Paenibacillus spongiae]UVI28414.1 Gmad2 immunoglobulin-like domain-containing protein [Paenibacillus spongiae]